MEVLFYFFLTLAGIAIVGSFALGFIVIRRWDEWVKL